MAAIASAIAACLMLNGCYSTNGIVRGENAPRLDVDQRFICDGDMQFSTVVDSRTGVTYLMFRDGEGQTSVGGITVLLNRDGTPVISEEVTE